MSGVYTHRPVMLKEVLAALNPRSGGKYFDGTLGGAGHARAILEASAPDGFLYGCDQDPRAIEEARARLSEFAGRWEIRQENFANMENWVPEGSCDGILLDLGVSSALLEDAERGFSFERDGPLDMRMNPGTELTAADVVNTFTAAELEEIFRNFGDVEEARKIALEIVNVRKVSGIVSTVQLAKIVERVACKHKKKIHPATQVFMALRIYVNDEFSAIKRGLNGALKILKPGGRLAVITFHSGEDRIVKNFGKENSRNYEVIGEVDLPEFRRPCEPKLKLVYRKPVVPSVEEIRENPRARSARLRVFEKL